MKLITEGFNYHIGYKMPFYITEKIEDFTGVLINNRYKIVLVKSGTLQYKINSIQYIITGPHIMCLNQNDVFEINNNKAEYIKIIYFHPKIINSKYSFDSIIDKNTVLISELQDLHYLKIFENTDNALKIKTLSISDEVFYRQRFEQIEDELRKQDNPHWPCRSRSFLFEILFHISNSNEKTNENMIQSCNDFSELVKNIIFYIQIKYQEKITIERIAKDLHTNRTTMSQSFKESTGITISQYLTKIRITMASTFLRETTLLISEIAQRTGFDDISHFSKAFKKETQYSPTEYRTKYCIFPK